MKKRILIFSGLLILFLSGLSFFYLTQVNPDFLRLNNGNTVTVSTDNNFSIDKVKIEFGISINTINRQNDLDLFTNKSKYTTIYNGSSSRKIKTDFGENDFLITYDDKYYLSFRQFILSDFSGGYAEVTLLERRPLRCILHTTCCMCSGLYYQPPFQTTVTLM